MDVLKLRLAGAGASEIPLAPGVYGIGRGDDDARALGLVDEADEPELRFCVDRRGVWLSVAQGTRGVHVNGREVRRMAMLRAGDAVYLDGIEMRLMASAPPEVPSRALKDAALDAGGDPRVVLRGVGGQYHGRSFTLERPRLVGSSVDADIRIDDPAFADRHARLELIDDEVVLRDLGSEEGSVVNGEVVRDAVLRTGDQIVFDAHHRFVVEAPSRRDTTRERVEDLVDEIGPDAFEAPPRRDSMRRWPWLLLAALLIAGLLALLLLFGSG